MGGSVGPDLSVIGSKASRENLLESILYPSRAISFGFDNWVVETKNGLQITGLIVEDRPTHLILRDANAKDHKIAATDIDRRVKSKKSLMPEDLIQFLSEEDLVDIVDYLHSLKTPPPAPLGRLRPGAAPEGGAVPSPRVATRGLYAPLLSP